MAKLRPLLRTLPDSYEVEHEDGDAIVSIAIAESFSQIVTVDCILSPYEEDTSEFTFPIVVSPIDSSGEPPFEMYDPREARPYIPDECRPLVIPTVCQALQTLVHSEKPQMVYFSTFAPDLKGRVLRKYCELIVALNAMDYDLEDHGTDSLGREFWLLRGRNG